MNETEEKVKGITMHELGVKMDQNTLEVKLLRSTLVDQVAKLIEAQGGRVPDGYIPLSTYKEHIQAYMDTYRFFFKVLAVIVLGLFGLSRMSPDLFNNIDKLWGN